MNTQSIEISVERFTMLFDNGDWRKIKISGEEIIRRIYFAVRDKEWLNVPYTLTGFRKEISGLKHLYYYEMRFENHPVHFIANLTVTIEDSRITLEADGKALSSFLKNRIGFCLHLPLQLRNTECKRVHPDGSSLMSVFPDLISPHQLLKNISSLEWSTVQGDINLSFKGDIFEMEDQRNWTDASYKIYSTPLDLPFPVEMKKGDSFYQKVTVMVSPRSVSAGIFSKSPVTANVDEKHFYPSIGMVCPQDISSGALLQADCGELPFSFFRIDFRFYRQEWKNTAYNDLITAQSLNVKIYAILYFGSNFEKEADDFVIWVKSLPEQPAFHSLCLLSCETFVLPDERLRYLSGKVRSCIPNVQVGGGTDANFAQLNRNCPDASCLDFICYSIQPKEHASDLLSIVENIQGIADTVRTAQSFSAGKDIHIISLSLYRRFNANIDFISREDINRKYADMGTPFEAAWFTGALHQLISAGATSIVCTALLNKKTPLTDLFHFMSLHRPEIFLDCGSLEPEKYSVLSWKSDNVRYSVFANHTDKELTVRHPFAEINLNSYEIFYFENSLKIINL